MQKLPEVSNMPKEKGTSRLILFQAVTGEVTTPC